ncbi:MAG: hypothetical protein R3C39_12870 [Dehalococcoidia bacterium]
MASATASAEATETPDTNEPPAATVELGGNELLGDFLTNADGHTLYVFANDEANKSLCDGTCAESWPPLTVADAASATGGLDVPGAVGTITRADGTLQVTYEDQPLYTFSGDTAVGDTKGNGVNDLWFVAKPDE